MSRDLWNAKSVHDSQKTSNVIYIMESLKAPKSPTPHPQTPMILSAQKESLNPPSAPQRQSALPDPHPRSAASCCPRRPAAMISEVGGCGAFRCILGSSSIPYNHHRVCGRRRNGGCAFQLKEEVGWWGQMRCGEV